MGIAIIGAGGHGRAALECLELSDGLPVDVAYYDDRWQDIGSIDTIPVLGPIQILLQQRQVDRVFVAIGHNLTRRELMLALDAVGKTHLTIIHPHATLSPRAALQDGTIGNAGVVVNRDAKIGRGVILNTLCSVGHDCHVGDFAQVASGVNLGGGAVIGEGAFLGIGTKVVPQARVGAWTVVGAGSVVLNDLPDATFCHGVPACVVRHLGPDELPKDADVSTPDLYE